MQSSCGERPRRKGEKVYPGVRERVKCGEFFDSALAFDRHIREEAANIPWWQGWFWGADIHNTLRRWYIDDNGWLQPVRFRDTGKQVVETVMFNQGV